MKVGFQAMDIMWDWFDSHQVRALRVDIKVGKPHILGAMHRLSHP